MKLAEILWVVGIVIVYDLFLGPQVRSFLNRS